MKKIFKILPKTNYLPKQREYVVGIVHLSYITFKVRVTCGNTDAIWREKYVLSLKGGLRCVTLG